MKVVATPPPQPKIQEVTVTMSSTEARALRSFIGKCRGERKCRDLADPESDAWRFAPELFTALEALDLGL